MAKKVLIAVLATALIALAGAFYFQFYFKFGEGVKAGTLNQVVYKGVVWKTYEGRLIMSGFRGGQTGTGVQSYEFEFSVTDKAIADSLMRCSGKNVELQYKEYFKPLPWRGHQKYVVDKILSVN